MKVLFLRGHALPALRATPEKSVQSIFTSPPYWGLRDYGIEPSVWGGDPKCEHVFDHNVRRVGGGKQSGNKKRWQHGPKDRPHGHSEASSSFCAKCGAWYGNHGLEPTLGLYIEHEVEVFREARRVLRDDGTLWLNLGDSYAAAINGTSAAVTKARGKDDRTFRDKPFSTVGPIHQVAPIIRGKRGTEKGGGRMGGGRWGGGLNPAGPVYITDGGQHSDRKNPKAWENHKGRVAAGGMIKPKDLCGIPWRVAFALQDDGWYLRSDIVWAKPNPMPESMKDRCTKAHEYIFMLTKNQDYFFDNTAIEEDAVYASNTWPGGGASNWAAGPGPHSAIAHSDAVKGRGVSPYQENVRKTGSTRYRSSRTKDELSPDRKRNGIDGLASSFRAIRDKRNKRDVWEIATQAFPSAHFATFPTELCEPVIKASTSEKGCCAKCGAPWQRLQKRRGKTGNMVTVKAKARMVADEHGKPLKGDNMIDRGKRGSFNARGGVIHKEDAGWVPTCECNAACVPSVIMDIFSGAGTLNMVANRLGRDSIGIEAGPQYVTMAKKRIERDAALFVNIEVREVEKAGGLDRIGSGAEGIGPRSKKRASISRDASRGRVQRVPAKARVAKAPSSEHGSKRKRRAADIRARRGAG